MGYCWNGIGFGGWSGMGLLGPLLSLVLFAGVLVVLGGGTAWMIRRISHSPAAQRGKVEPLEIARRRLASGEITITEFEEIRDRLQN